MRIADLFCGAGGAAKGLHDAGFEVIGFDIKPQPRYAGDEFHQADALEVDLSGFDAVWASPPCQGYSIMNNLPWLKGREYPLLILPVREMLDAAGLPYVIENVQGARFGAKGLAKRGLEEHGMKAGWLCGQMFGLPFYRHRMFESNWFWLAPGHPKHLKNTTTPDCYGKGPTPGQRGVHKPEDVKPNQNPHQSFSVRAASPIKGINAWCAQSNQAMGHNGRKAAPEERTFTRADGTVGRYEPKISMASFERCQVIGMDDPKRNERDGQSYPQHAGAGWRLAAAAMGIDWMTRAELTQAIPPAYSEFLGRQLMKAIVNKEMVL